MSCDLFSYTLLDITKVSEPADLTTMQLQQHQWQSARLTNLYNPLTRVMWKELWEKKDAENSTTHDNNALAISNSWLPLLSTSRINMNFPQTFDPCMCCWANNLRHYRGETFPAYLQSCFALFLKDVFYRPAFEEGNNASWNREKLNMFSSIWKTVCHLHWKGNNTQPL